MIHNSPRRYEVEQRSAAGAVDDTPRKNRFFKQFSFFKNQRHSVIKPGFICPDSDRGCEAMLSLDTPEKKFITVKVADGVLFARRIGIRKRNVLSTEQRNADSVSFKLLQIIFRAAELRENLLFRHSKHQLCQMFFHVRDRTEAGFIKSFAAAGNGEAAGTSAQQQKDGY